MIMFDVANVATTGSSPCLEMDAKLKIDMDSCPNITRQGSD